MQTKLKEHDLNYQLDTSFIQRPHHTDPRRLYSQTSTDWQQRVDHDRLRRDRLARARAGDGGRTTSAA